MNEIISVIYECDRWVPNYTHSQEGCTDTLVFTVKKGEFNTRAFLFEYAGGFLLWAYSRDVGAYVSYGCMEGDDIERALIHWMNDSS